MRCIPLRWIIFGLCFVAVVGLIPRRVSFGMARIQNTSPALTQAKKLSPNKVGTNNSGAKTVTAKPPQAPPAKTEGQKWTIKSWGKTVELAEMHALTKAREKLAEYLVGLKSPVSWLPDDEYIRKNLMSGLPEKCADSENEKVNDEPVPCWLWTVTLVPAQLEFFRQEEARDLILKARQMRASVAEERMAALGKLVGVAVLALCGVWLILHRNGGTEDHSASKG
jgi:hypothetical protein